MKAIIFKKIGKTEEMIYTDVDKPIPEKGEILVKVIYGSVTIGDVLMKKMPRLIVTVLGFLLGFKPMDIPGVEFSGTVEETGSEVTKLKKGDKIFGTATGMRYGANAEYLCVPEKGKINAIAKMPQEISFDIAAALPIAGMTVLYIFNKCKINQSDRVMVYGASGSVGSIAVKILKNRGITVTGVCSTENIDMVKSLGADRVIDYKTEDFTQTNEKYDFIFDAVGKTSKSKCKNILKKGGYYKSIKLPTKEKVENLELLGKLAAEGSIKPYIEKTVELNQVPETHTYVATGRKKGNIIVKISEV